jgi:hypothetical protein
MESLCVFVYLFRAQFSYHPFRQYNARRAQFGVRRQQPVAMAPQAVTGNVRNRARTLKSGDHNCHAVRRLDAASDRWRLCPLISLVFVKGTCHV